MADTADFFPYQTYRKNQKEMLEEVEKTAEENGILLIDAPTGSGKSSVIASLLAKANGRKILVAVRTISQLQIFIRELDLIRQKKQPTLKFVYLIGKGNMCPLGGYGDVYRRCEGVKAFTSALMQQRADRGSFDPATDKQILEQIRKQDREHPLICPYFVNSRVFVQSEEGGRRMIPSPELRRKSDIAQKQIVRPNELLNFAGKVCPYDLMLSAAKGADVIICNYYHLFNDDIREQLYVNLQCEEHNVMLLLDEAHNLGDVIQTIQSIRIRDTDIEAAANEVASLRDKVRGSEAVRHILPRIAEFIDGLQRSNEAEDWFDPQIFNRFIIKGSLYGKPEAMLEDIISIKEAMRERGIERGDYRESAIEKLCEFLIRLYRSSTDPSFLTVYTKDAETITLEVRNIDPADRLQELVSKHAATILISGTLSPVDSYRKYYFGSMPVKTLSLANSFPKENRLVLGTRDITTAFSKRQNAENTQAIVEYILAFAKLPGNIAVYFPSYQLQNRFAEACVSKIRNKQVFIEPRESDEANEALKEFISLPGKHKSGILFAVCGGKWSEGLDYRGDQLTAALVIGLPLAPFTPVRRMVNSYYRRKFGAEGEFIAYTLPAINKSMQALGRVLRTENDRGVLILGDQRFLEGEIFGGLSPWMQDELMECDVDTVKSKLEKWGRDASGRL
ncbi:DEAD_2 domain protein [Methanocorpusculum labreanum Z]|uniref:DEAD_2 domain protein n=1 Tax=Methanocorpusculum labreanum (strain ATCC 43576 / DSM 4855 / Z) TaxID=410358 RepID=A2SSG7_METLZ|nr:ATP-dependent DNA helicase [Methanocorpusculum labreanum]ABN07273.1 DEAD_2 domain protein [Methanocorpusculum labreanum Z]